MAEESQSPDALVSEVQSKLEELGSLLEGSGAVTPQDKAKFQKIKSQFDSFVSEDLSLEPGVEAPEESEPESPIQPMNAGANTKIKQAY